MTAPVFLFGALVRHTRPAWLSATLAVACIASAQAAPATLNLEVGQQKTWTQPRPIVRAATANDDIVGINVAPPRGVIVTAKKPGAATISVWDSGSQSTPAAQFNVVVSPGGSVSKVDSGAQIDASGTRLRLSGQLSSLERHAAIERAVSDDPAKPAANVVDTSTSKFDVQVQIDVKIVEVSRKKLMSSGFYMNNVRNGTIRGISNPSNLSSLETDPTLGRTLLSSTGFIPRPDAFNIFSWGSNTLAVFSALESNGFAYTLAEPSLTALSGQTATFLAGGELPIPLRTGAGADSAVTILFKEFGIRLGLSPTVLDDQRMTLKVSPEVSEIDPSLSVTTGGFNIPGLRVRRTDTTVAIGDGETFVLSGLVSRVNSADVAKFPFLGDIPILGAFFRSDRLDREDKELLMIVTPHLVRPFARDAKLPNLPNLPGEDLRKYEPGYLHMLLLETGKFDSSESGFSR